MREQIAFMVMIALLFGSFFNAFTFSHEQLSNIQLEKQAALLGEKVLICTADGYEWKTWKELAQESSSHNSSLKCKGCNGVGSTPQLSAAANYNIEYPDSVLKTLLPEYRVYIPELAYSNSQPRSPPYFS